MSFLSFQNRRRRFPQHLILRLLLLAAAGGLAYSALVTPITLRPASFPVKVGDVAPQDIQAPRAITYTSSVLTDSARKQAEQAVAPVFLPVDPALARRQIERIRIALTYINSVRLDSFANQAQQMNDLQALTDLQLTPETAQAILSLNDSRWQAVQDESINVLEQVMRNTIREDRLEDARRSIPTLISFSMPQDQASIVAELVSAFVIPNSLYSIEQTDVARQNVRAQISPVTQSYMTGETVIMRGQVITDASWEAMEQLGLVKPRDNTSLFTGSAALVLLLSGFVALYMRQRTDYPMDDLRSLVLIALLFILFLFGARLIIPNRTVIPYLFPIPAFGLTIAVLFNTELGLILSLILSVLAGFQLPNSLDLSLYYMLGSLCGVLSLGRGRRVSSFIWAGLIIGLSGSAIILAYRLPDAITDWVGLATLIGAAMFNGIASASLTLLFQFLFAQMLGLTTALQLLEISRPDHPMLQYLLRNAPGTYQHSLQVANLAEQAAEAVGADALLTRVGALYHDAGKATNPLYFIENQVPGNLNPHEDLDPLTSSATIIQHVSDGLRMAKKHRLPPRIQSFISEHHGTMLTRYQYARAVEAAGGQPDAVDKDLFRYPGPRPRSRETALVMLADGCEARARAELPKDEVELRLLIKRVFDFCQSEGQLDETRLTLKDLTTAMESFSNTLRGIYHPRILYPELKAAPNSPELPAGSSAAPATMIDATSSAQSVPTTPISK